MPESTSRPFEFASRRLLVSGRERRLVKDIGIFDITGIAQAINIGLLPPKLTAFSRIDVVDMHRGVVPFDKGERPYDFADYMLALPGLVVALPGGELRMLDGRKRTRQAFLQGASEVRAAVFSLKDARLYGLVDESRPEWKVAEATESDPLEALPGTLIEDALVPIETDASGARRPQLTEIEIRLDTAVTYYVNALIDIEDYIRRLSPGDTLIAGKSPSSKKEDWARWFFDEFLKQNDIQFPISYDNIKNKASSAVQYFTGLTGRVDYKKLSKDSWKSQILHEVVSDRNGTADQCVAVIKADIRLKLDLLTARHLIAREHDNKPIDASEVRDEYYHRAHEANRVSESKIFRLSRQDLEGQLRATSATGIDMNSIYHDYHDLDSLFQAHLLRYNYIIYGEAVIAPGLIETVCYRKDMQIQCIEDKMSPYWNEIFYRWDEIGIDDQRILRQAKVREKHANFRLKQTMIEPISIV